MRRRCFGTMCGTGAHAPVPPFTASKQQPPFTKLSATYQGMGVVFTPGKRLACHHQGRYKASRPPKW